MPNILQVIIEKKREDLKKLDRETIHNEALKLKYKPGISLRKALIESSTMGIISEIKRASPSKGDLNINLQGEEVAKTYMESGAKGISVLTEENFFKGSYDDLKKVREIVNIPILNKDFFVDKIQIDLCKIHGGDVILLILMALNDAEAKELLDYAHSFNLEVLMEVHDEEELLRAFNLNPDIIGINNRNLETFEVSLNNTLSLSKYFVDDRLIISESGIKTKEDVKALKENNVRGMLIGETFVTSKSLKETFKELTDV